MKIKIQKPLPKQSSQFVAAPSIQKKSENATTLTPPKLSFQDNIAQLEEYYDFGDWEKIQYGYQPGEAHRKMIESWIKLDISDIYAALNKKRDTAVLHNLLEATNQASAKKSKTIKKLKEIKGLIQIRLNALKALQKGDATDEKITATDKETIDATWNRIPGKNVHFKHIEGNNLLTNTNLETKLRDVKQQDSHTERGSTGYDLFIPYSIGKGKHWYPIILDPILYVDIHVNAEDTLYDLSDFENQYKEYQELIVQYNGDKEKALLKFADNHIDGDKNNIKSTQDATIYHEAGHVKEYEDKYKPLMSNFFNAVSGKLKNYKNDKPQKAFMELAETMWRDYATDQNHVTHREIIINQIRALIAKYEKQNDLDAFDKYDKFSEARDKVHNH